MKINYKLTNADFLEYQLYTSSKSELHKKKRSRSRIVIPIIYVILGLYFVNKNENNSIGIVFTGVGIFWFVCYPMYSKWRYKRHYQKHIEENYKNRINTPVEIDFDAQAILAKDFTSESKINGSELKELIEMKNHFYIKLTTDLCLIVPKHAIKDLEEFKKRVTQLGAKYVDELHWKWK